MQDWKTEIQTRFAPKTLDADVLEELTQHAESTYAAHLAEHLDEAAARDQVRAEIRGWATQPHALGRRPGRTSSVTPPASTSIVGDAWFRDLAYAVRLIVRQPGHAALVVATMTLGITATVVLASVAYGVLLKPLPWADAPRLVRLYETREGSTRRFQPMMTTRPITRGRRPRPRRSMRSARGRSGASRSPTLVIHGRSRR